MAAATVAAMGLLVATSALKVGGSAESYIGCAWLSSPARFVCCHVTPKNDFARIGCFSDRVRLLGGRLGRLLCLRRIRLAPTVHAQWLVRPAAPYIGRLALGTREFRLILGAAYRPRPVVG